LVPLKLDSSSPSFEPLTQNVFWGIFLFILWDQNCSTPCLLKYLYAGTENMY